MSTVTITTDELRAIVADAVKAAVRERTEPLERHVHQLAVAVNSKLAVPTDTLTTAQAAKRAKVCTKTVLKWIALGILSDRRAGIGKGAHLILADELEVFITDGEDAARRYRERMGRA